MRSLRQVHDQSSSRTARIIATVITIRSLFLPKGVLLLNVMLTVEAHDAASHKMKGWEAFTDTAIRQLCRRQSGIVFLLWGRFAQVGDARRDCLHVRSVFLDSTRFV